MSLLPKRNRTHPTDIDQYDVTRKALLKGREDLLALAAAQLRFKAEKQGESAKRKRIWVDVGGGTGFNIEAMAEFVNVPEFFSSVYLVDFSPSLCEVARKRFARLGWTNVKVICQDARKFRLEDYENGPSGGRTSPTPSPSSYFEPRPDHGGADLVTMSYSLSMIVGNQMGRISSQLLTDTTARLLLGHRLSDIVAIAPRHHGGC
jgi:betaine lipid synthase